MGQRGLEDVHNIVHTYVVTKRLQTIGNSAGIIVDKPILELLGITTETDLELTTDGHSLIITPRHGAESRARKLAKVQQRTLKNHAGTFRKLAE
jgi:antitoxin MazE